MVAPTAQTAVAAAPWKDYLPKHICLITPPSPFLLDQRVFPFLGPLNVARALEMAQWPVETLDLSGIRNYVDVVKYHVSRSEATVYGLTGTTPQFPAAVLIAQAIREAKPRARLIIGGTHATLTMAGVRKEVERGVRRRAHRSLVQLEQYFDTVVAGDGELTIFLASQGNAPKVIDADDRHSEYWLNDEMLDTMPLPARHLIDLDSYKYQIGGERATSLIAQLGCPYKCGFCAGRSSPMLRHIRTRSSKQIVEEMLHLYRTHGIKGFMFYDDELNVSPSMLELMELIAKTQRDLGVEWKLRGFIKSERFTDDQALAMHKAGFRQILVGFESGHPRILENIQKIAKQQDNTRCMDIARRFGLEVKALMSLGHPGESKETIEETKRWLLYVKPKDFDATVITPYLGSPYCDEAEPGEHENVWVYTARSGDRLYEQEVDYARDADYYKGNPDEGYVSHVWTDFLSRDELVRERDRLERSVRRALGIPFNPARPEELFEASMGMTKLPTHILRGSGSF